MAVLNDPAALRDGSVDIAAQANIAAARMTVEIRRNDCLIFFFPSKPLETVGPRLGCSCFASSIVPSVRIPSRFLCMLCVPAANPLTPGANCRLCNPRRKFPGFRAHSADERRIRDRFEIDSHVFERAAYSRSRHQPPDANV